MTPKQQTPPPPTLFGKSYFEIKEAVLFHLKYEKVFFKEIFQKNDDVEILNIVFDIKKFQFRSLTFDPPKKSKSERTRYIIFWGSGMSEYYQLNVNNILTDDEIETYSESWGRSMNGSNVSRDVAAWNYFIQHESPINVQIMLRSAYLEMFKGFDRDYIFQQLRTVFEITDESVTS